MPQTFEMTRRVAFAETDMAGVVHFTNYLRYMEEAENAFLHSLGLNVILEDNQGTLGFPRIAAACKYARPARYGDELNVSLSVAENSGKAITYAFVIVGGEAVVARGEIQVACCRFPPDGEPYAIPIPQFVLEKIPRCRVEGPA